MRTDLVRHKVYQWLEFDGIKPLITTALLGKMQACFQGQEKFWTMFGKETTLTAYKLRRYGHKFDFQSFAYDFLSDEAYARVHVLAQADQRLINARVPVIDENWIDKSISARKRDMILSVMGEWLRVSRRFKRAVARAYVEAFITVLELDYADNSLGPISTESRRNARIRTSRRTIPSDRCAGTLDLDLREQKEGGVRDRAEQAVPDSDPEASR